MCCFVLHFTQVPGQPLEVTARPSCGRWHRRGNISSLYGAGERRLRRAPSWVKLLWGRTALCRNFGTPLSCSRQSISALSEDPNLVGQEEPFPGPDNQSKMKRSVENAEQVGMQLPKINHNDKTLTLLDSGLFTPTAGQYFRDEQRRRHSQYDRGWRRPVLLGKAVRYQASSFQPSVQLYKGKNALVFYPEGSPTVAGALSQDMDISQERQNLRTSTT
ncbi:meiosis mei2 [Fusarium subglutinans]|uniref:Meiosis mei2 n=1 Tax=Gibberella subglutinans TaxID=42677 RepID=A0A8H5V899_GIBSU|nr:meiosis mei2 [Fusarium subglutinans]KAF5611884.1 meiosis mei2 [Fusarium subglutinans]